MFKRNLDAYREPTREQIGSVGTANSRSAQLEILGTDNNWRQVTGWFDSGADGNVAPLSVAEHGLNVGDMRFNLNNRLPTNEKEEPFFVSIFRAMHSCKLHYVPLVILPMHTFGGLLEAT